MATLRYENIISIAPAYADGSRVQPSEILPSIGVNKGNAMNFAVVNIKAFWCEFVTTPELGVTPADYQVGDPIAIEGTTCGVDGAYTVAAVENRQGARRSVLCMFNDGVIPNPVIFSEFMRRIPWADNKDSGTTPGRIIFGEYQPASAGGTFTSILKTDGGKIIGLLALAITGILVVRWALK